jgi:hypothetical protein
MGVNNNSSSTLGLYAPYIRSQFIPFMQAGTETPRWHTNVYVPQCHPNNFLNTKYSTTHLHAPISSTQKLKLMMNGGEFTYASTLPPQMEAHSGLICEIGVGNNYFISLLARIGI